MNITSQVRDVKLDDCYWLVIYNITVNYLHLKGEACKSQLRLYNRLID